MNKFLAKIVLIVALMLSASTLKAQNYTYKGIYVYGIDTILSEASGNSANILLRYLRDSSFNAVTISLGVLNLNTSPTYTTKLAAFMKKARTQYGIKYFSAVVSDYNTLLTEVHPYQISRTDSNERFNHYNYEFEYWNDANYLSGKTYCVNFLQPGGYSCDSVGAWSYFSKNMKRVDSLAQADNIKSTVYIGVSSKDTLKNRFVANTVDLVMLACYNADTTKLYMGHTTLKLTAYSKANHKVDVLPIFASLTKSAAENLKNYLIGPAPVGKHSEASPMGIFMREYNSTLPAAVKSNINIVGYKWFKYGGMPKDSSNTAINLIPVGLAAVPSSTSAVLSWTAVSGANSYRIMYSKANLYNFTKVSSPSNSFTLSGLQANTAYQFIVYSVTSDNKTSASSAVFGFTTSASGSSCALPTGLSSSGVTDLAATLSWTAVSGATSYNIQYRIVGAGSWISTTSSTNTKNLASLTASSAYEFQVQSNCGTTSAFTASSNFSTTAPPCISPTGLSSSSVTTNSATVGATAVSVATSYNIQYRTVGTSTWTTTTSPTVSKTLSGLNPASTYEFQEQSVCATNTSSYSASSNFATPAPPCNVASGLTSASVTYNSATVSWAAVSGAVSYNLQYRIVGAASWISTTNAGVSKALTGLTSASVYEFQVQTVCAASNTSAFSSSASFSTPAPPCNIASGLSSSAVTYNSATVSWTAVSGASSYNLQYRVVGTAIWSNATSAAATKNLTGLTSSSAYEFQVQTVCSVSNTSAFSSSASFSTPAVPCSVPSGLGSATITSNSATLSWASVSGAISYNLKYRLVGATTWISATCAVTSISISGLNASSSYEFQAQAVCSVSNLSAFSSSSTFSTPAPPCNTPTGLSSSAVTYNAATLSWTAVAGVTSYNLNYRIQGATTWTTTTSAGASKTITSLTASSTYEFQVQSNCGSGNLSAFTTSATFATFATPCALPSGLTNSALTYNSVTLNWNAVSGASGYNIQYRITGSASWTSATSLTNTKSITGLNASAGYEFQVQSDCGGGNISAYTASSLFTTQAPPCNVLTGLVSSMVTDNSATLGWTDFAGASAYSIRYRIVGVATWTSTTSAINSKNISGLTSSSSYEFQIQSDCGGGNLSAFSTSGTFATIAPPCNVPTGLSPSSVTNTTATLNWNAISGASSYTIQYRIVGAASWTTLTSATNSINVSGLTSNSTYEFGIQTNCGSGNTSAFSASANFATSAPPCSVPTGLSSTSITHASSTLNWTAVSGASNYTIEYRIVGSSVWISLTSANNSINLIGLTALSNYEFQVQTECSSGNSSAFSSSANFNTIAPPCDVPLGLTSSSITDNSASLGWSNYSGAVSFTIHYRIIGSTTWTTVTSATNTKNISGLSPADSYEFQVQSDCGSGNTSSYSVSSNFTTLAPPCNIPTGQSASGVTDNAATLNWTAVSAAASYNLKYRVVGAASWVSSTSVTNSKALTALTASSNYEFQVQTECTYGNTSNFTSSSVFSTVAPPCNTPSGLSSSSVTYNSASLNWTAVSGISGYSIRYRITGASNWITSTSATNSKNLTGLSASSTYEFEIQSNCGGSNTSAFSSSSTFVTPAPPCNVPSGLSSSAVTYNSATINWTAVSGVGGYFIRYRIVGASTWTSLTNASNSYSLATLNASSNYEFQLGSDCGSGNVSAYSASSVFSTPAPPCNAPTGLSSSAITYNSASVNWTAFSGASGYSLKYRVIGSPTWIILTPSTTNQNLSSLTSSANYEFKVASTCGSGNISSYTSTSVFATPPPPCNVPTGLSSSSVTNNSATLNWTAIAGVSSYIVQYRIANAVNWTSSSSTTNSKTITGLNSSSNYEFQIQSDCGSGNLSSFSSITDFSTPAPPCNVPSGLIASAITDNSVTLDWLNFSGSVGYSIQYRVAGASNWILTSSILNSKNLTGLTASSNYEFQVQSDCGNGNSSVFSTSGNFTTTAPPCNIPSGLAASSVSNNTATLNWNSIAGAASYAVEYRVVGSATWIPLTSATNTLNLNSLTANAIYEFQVQSICSGSSSSIFSGNSTFATSSPPCANANGLNSSSITSNTANIDWLAVSGASGYNVQYRISGTSVWTTSPITQNAMSLSGLLPLSNYEFQIQTECSSGNTSAFSASGNFTTLAPPCIVPIGLSSAAITDNSASLSWTDFAGSIGYNIQYRMSSASAWISASSNVNSLNISGLTSSTAYEFQVQSNCGAGNLSSYSSSSSFTTLSPPCSIPSGLAALSLTFNSATLDWNVVSGATGYNLNYRIVGASTWNLLPSATNTFNLTSLSSSSNYEFQVQTVCGGSNTSSFSGTSVFVTLAAPCSMPTNLTSSALTINSVTLNWQAVSGAIGYSIHYRIVGSANWNASTSATASLALSGLTSSSTYEFQVAADCGNGNASSYTSSANFITLTPPCMVASGLTSTAVSTNDATVNWGSIGGAIGYTIQYRVMGTTAWLQASSNINSAYLSNLANSSTYEFQVQSDCGNGNTSNYSASANFSTLVPPCSVATGFAANSVTSNSAVLDWVSVSGAASYSINYRIVGSSNWINLTSNSSSKNLTALNPITNYEYQIQTVCQSGNSSAYSATAVFATDIPPCNVPAGLGASAITDNSAQLNWNSFAGASGYTLQYRNSASATWTTLSSATNSFSLSNLLASTSYQFQVESDCSAGITSGFSTPVTFVTQIQPCLAPLGLNATAVTATGANLVWTAQNNAIDYAISYRLNGASNWTNLTSAAASLNLNGLLGASNYEYQVQSICASGSSAFSSISTFSTGNSSCDVALNLSSTSLTETTGTVSWDAVAGATNYLVEFRVVGTGVWTSVVSNSTSENLSGLLPASSYEFHVQTLCSASNTSAFSNAANFSTLAPPCGIPTTLNSAGATSNSVSLTWDNISNADSYNIEYRASGTTSWISLSSSTPSINLLALTPGTIYEFQVQTNCLYGLSQFSNLGSFTTLTSSGCDASSGLFASSIKSSSAKLNWNPATGASTYKVQYRKEGTIIWTNKTTSFTNKAITSLTPNTQYEFQVQTNCGTSASSYTSPFTFLTSKSITGTKSANTYAARAAHSSLGITLNWTSSSEENLAYYTIERSEDNVEYEPIRNVAAAGNSTFPQDYEFNDIDMKLSPVYGTVWYRLSMTDNKGNLTYLRTIEVTQINEFEDVFKVYPNPTTDDNINLTVKLDRKEEMLVVLMDILGNQVYSKVVVTDDNGFAASGINPGKDLKPGIYEIIGYSSKRQMSKKLIIY